jgi:hypothetical protein
MNRQALTNLCNQIYSRYPEVTGSHPKVQDRPGDQVLLIFHGKTKTADGRSMSRTVRVIADQAGKIIKVTTSK